MSDVVISGSGLFTPPHCISNTELVDSFNQYVALTNAETGSDLPGSSVAFIEKASGIKQRYVMDKSGILDPRIMAPRFAPRSNEEPSIQCEMAVAAAKQALKQAHKKASEIDAVLVACSNMARPYPAVAIEVQQALGCTGYGYDLNVACASAAFGIQAAIDAVNNGSANCVLVVNPEICSAHLNFRDRESHFIFGDAATAVIIEKASTATSDNTFQVLGCQLKTKFSNNIRNNFGFLNCTHPESAQDADKLFVQQGRKVFKEVTPMVAQTISEHLNQQKIQATDVKRFWLHQANLHMNLLIAKKLLGETPNADRTPTILDQYANTSSAGSVIAFHLHQEDMKAGDIGCLCAFGAGYSVGNVILQKY